MSIESKRICIQAIQNLLAPCLYLYSVGIEATCDEVRELESQKQGTYH